MTLNALLSDLERLGVALEADGDRLRYKAPAPLPPALLSELKVHKAGVLARLAGPPDYSVTRSGRRIGLPLTEAPEPEPARPVSVGTLPEPRSLPRFSVPPVPPLPEPLAALVRAASAGVLPPGPVKLDTGQADSLKDYTLGWAAAYLLGDREHALSELWRAYGAWPKRSEA